MKLFKNFTICFLSVSICIFSLTGGLFTLYSQAAVMVNADIPCKSAILCEGISGKVLYEKDADLKLPPASITKVMSLLLVMEALDCGKINMEDQVVTTPHAASMGGSQIWLKENEIMTVHELLKAAAISSANDATVALGEHVAGSEDAFVKMMNEKAEALHMENTHFENATGLDSPNHYSTARDISIMANELMKHDTIKNYSTVWMDELRDGKTQLVNTNKLVRFYKGTTGLKTGTTDGAGSCLCATALREGLPLTAVTMGSATSDNRFLSARGLLDYGFANYQATKTPQINPPLDPIKVKKGVYRCVGIKAGAPPYILTEKGSSEDFKTITEVSEFEIAPVAENQPVGKVKVLQDGVVISEFPLMTSFAVEKMTFPKALCKVAENVFYMGN